MEWLSQFCVTPGPCFFLLPQPHSICMGHLKEGFVHVNNCSCIRSREQRGKNSVMGKTYEWSKRGEPCIRCIQQPKHARDGQQLPEPRRDEDSPSLDSAETAWPWNILISNFQTPELLENTLLLFYQYTNQLLSFVWQPLKAIQNSIKSSPQLLLLFYFTHSIYYYSLKL